jgi:hypothetical protein
LLVRSTLQLFKDIAKVLLRLYLYAKSPKKSRELPDIVEDLKEVQEFSGGCMQGLISKNRGQLLDQPQT